MGNEALLAPDSWDMTWLLDKNGEKRVSVKELYVFAEGMRIERDKAKENLQALVSAAKKALEWFDDPTGLPSPSTDLFNAVCEAEDGDD
jgi:hypothetical protein